MIFVFEGPHGVGKTTIINALRKKGYSTVDEHYMDLDTCGFDQQGAVCELKWVTSWCFCVKVKHQNHKIIITDRSPISAAIYTTHEGLFTPMLRLAEACMKEIGNIRVIKLTGDMDTIYERILKRLEKEPDRKKYNEKNRDHLLSVFQMYEQVKADLTICTTDECVDVIVNRILAAIEMLMHEEQGVPD